jgi:hypothetical protein
MCDIGALAEQRLLILRRHSVPGNLVNGTLAKVPDKLNQAECDLGVTD